MLGKVTVCVCEPTEPPLITEMLPDVSLPPIDAVPAPLVENEGGVAADVNVPFAGDPV